MDKDNVVELPDEVHQAIHLIFGNLNKEESKLFLDIILTPNSTWTHEDLAELRTNLRRVLCSSS